MECPNCEQQIADTEKTCPKCHINLEEFDEETLKKLETAQSIIDKRKAKAAAEKKKIEDAAKPPKKKLGFFGSLGGN